MAYLVKVMPRALKDLDAIYLQIGADQSDAALEWYRGLKAAILSLANSPNRCPMTTGSGTFRHLLYGDKRNTYRIIYHVLERQKRVQVVHIRHGARDQFKSASDLRMER
jgi:plasmid stabilization system protein ParE